ncbi:MAG: DNA polymerase Y family protein [Dehalococcoidia bacterium]
MATFGRLSSELLPLTIAEHSFYHKCLPSGLRRRPILHVACVLLPHFSWQVEVLRHPELRGRPVLVLETTGSKTRVFDCSPQVTDCPQGMPLQEAMARCSGAVLLEADLPRYRVIFERILDSLEQRSPEVESAGLGCAYVDVRGLEKLYGGQVRLAMALLHAVPAPYQAQLALGPGKFPAYVAAAMAAPGQVRQVSEDTQRFLAEFAVDILPVSWRTRTRLRSFGLHTLEQVAALPVGPLQAQFGPEGRLLWEFCNGIDRSPLMPRRPEVTVTERLTFPAPVVSMEPVLTATETLLRRAYARSEVRGRCARVATLQAQVMRGPVWERRVAFSQPAGGKQRAFFAIKSSIESLVLPGPLENIALTLSGLTGDIGQQESLFADVRRRENLSQALRQLEARLGKKPPIFQVRDVEPWSRIPERRQALVPFVP